MYTCSGSKHANMPLQIQHTIVPRLPKYTQKKELYITQQLKDDKNREQNPKVVKLWHGDKETRGVAILIFNIYEKDGWNNTVYFYTG